MKTFTKIMLALAIVMVVYGSVTHWPDSLFYSAILLLAAMAPALFVAIFKKEIK